MRPSLPDTPSETAALRDFSPSLSALGQKQTSRPDRTLSALPIRKSPSQWAHLPQNYQSSLSDRRTYIGNDWGFLWQDPSANRCCRTDSRSSHRSRLGIADWNRRQTATAPGDLHSSRRPGCAGHYLNWADDGRRLDVWLDDGRGVERAVDNLRGPFRAHVACRSVLHHAQ